MPTKAQLSYAKYLISKLNVDKVQKQALCDEIESMNLDAAIGFIDDLKRQSLTEWMVVD